MKVLAATRRRRIGDSLGLRTGPDWSFRSVLVESGKESLWSNGAPSLREQLIKLVVSNLLVESNPKPSSMADVWRVEETFRVFCNPGLLFANRGGAPDSENAVIVVVVEKHGERLFPANEEGGTAVTQPFFDLRKLKRDVSDSSELRIGHAQC
jgi:hypothetical protein